MRSFIGKLPVGTLYHLVLAALLAIPSVLLLPDNSGWAYFGLLVISLLCAAWFLLFDDTLNRVQYIPLGKGRYLYYLTRDDGGPRVDWTFKAFMSMTSYPWLKGTGRSFRIPLCLTFQVGIAKKMYVTSKEDGLSKVLGAHPLSMTVEDIRDLEPSRLVKKESIDGL